VERVLIDFVYSVITFMKSLAFGQCTWADVMRVVK
jgi:hypothetical protein